jgi:hypothetical protein
MKGRSAWILLLICLIAACSKEYSYEGGVYRKCIACSYLPLCDSSSFVYVDSSGSVPDTLSGTVQIQKDTVINGKKFTEVNGFAALNNGLLYNCDDQDYQLFLSLAAFGVNTDSLANVLIQALNLPFPIPPSLLNIPSTIKTSVLKAALPVNATWTDTIYKLSFPPLVSVFAGIDYKILEKNVQRTVFQKTYSDVIHVKGTLNLVSNLGNLPFSVVIDFYFAKDVGLIEMQAQNNGVLQRVTRLYSYHL